MRKLFLGVFVALLAITSVYGQEYKKAKDLPGFKDAKKALKTFETSSDLNELQIALDAVDDMMGTEASMQFGEAYVMAGDVYAAAAANYITRRSIAGEGEEVDVLITVPATRAAEAYMKAMELGEDDGEDGLKDLQNNLSNEGIYALQDEEYPKAQQIYAVVIEAHKALGDDSTLSEEALNEEYYYAGLSAIINEDYDAAEPYLVKLYEADYDDARIYDGLYKIYEGRDDMEQASKYLTEGRKKFPENTQLLFTEINYYIALDQREQLIEKLQEAIAAEPNNMTLYATTGSVYEKLYNDAEDEAARQQYFELAKENYEAGLKIKEDETSLIYSLGALYFNRAANKTQELVTLGEDLSREGQQKYEALEKEVNAEFEKALPYFIKAEKTDPANRNTLIALKEIYARQNDFETSQEFKKRLDMIEAGEEIKMSYFKEKGM